MKVNSVVKIPVVLTKMDKRSWEIPDKNDPNKKIAGVVNTLRGVLVPSDPNIDPAFLKEIEFSIYDNNPDQPGIAEISKTLYRNEERFEKGEVFAMVDAYMAPKVNRDGIVTIYSPYVNAIEVKTPETEEEKAQVLAASRKNVRL